MKDRTVFKWLSKVIPWLRMLRLVTGLKDSRQFFNQWDAKPKPIAPCTRHFSRASSELQVIARNCDWFMVLSAPVVIGRSNCFGFGFSTVILKPLKLSEETVLLRRWESVTLKFGIKQVDRAVFKWLSKNQNQSNYSDQSQQEQTARWTNHNSYQLSATRSKRGKNHAYVVRLVLVVLLIGWKTGASLFSQSLRVAIAIAWLRSTVIWKLL